MSKFLVLCWLLMGLGILACQEADQGRGGDYQGPKSVLEDIDMEFSDSGRVKVRMLTQEQLTLFSEDRVYPKEVKLWFYDPQGRVSTQIRGDSARFFRMKNQYKLMGHVVIYSPLKDQTLKTQEFTWVPDRKVIFTDKQVEVRSPREYYFGRGLEAAQDFSTFTFKQVQNSAFYLETLP